MEEEYRFYGCYYIRSKRHDVYVSNFGNVKDNGKIRPKATKALGDRVYIAVAKLFLPNPENKPRVDHIDTNRNNNRVDNLRWVTDKENMNNELTRLHCSEAMKRRWASGVYDNYVKSQKGRTPWNKGLRGEGQSRYGVKLSDEVKHLMSIKHKGKKKVWDNDSHTSYHYVMPNL